MEIQTISEADTGTGARPGPEIEAVEHRVRVAVAAETVYAALADVTRWPLLFPPTVHAERLESDGCHERIRVVATAGTGVRSWESRRTLDATTGAISFRQIRTTPPVACMEGRWQVVNDSDEGCTVVLGHRFAATDAAGQDWLRTVVDENSRRELDSLSAALKSAPAADDPRVVDFVDSVVIDAPAARVFDFINDAHLWAERLPHVAEVNFTVDDAGIQDLAMTTRSPDGSQHRTRSYRVVLDDGSISYKQFTLPDLMACHTGRWSFRSEGGRTVASSAHTVLIDADHIADRLGADADLETARTAVTETLRANSLATLHLAKSHTEGR